MDACAAVVTVIATTARTATVQHNEAVIRVFTWAADGNPAPADYSLIVSCPS